MQGLDFFSSISPLDYIMSKVESHVWARLQYLRQHLESDEFRAVANSKLPWAMLYCGSSRAVYDFGNPNWILKVYISMEGLAESEREMEILKEIQSTDLEQYFPKVCYFGDNFMIQEKLKSFDSLLQFMPYYQDSEEILSILESRGVLFSFNDARTDDGGSRPDQWGLRGDQLVLLDFGFDD